MDNKQILQKTIFCQDVTCYTIYTFLASKLQKTMGKIK